MKLVEFAMQPQGVTSQQGAPNDQYMVRYETATQMIAKLQQALDAHRLMSVEDPRDWKYAEKIGDFITLLAQAEDCLGVSNDRLE